MSTFNWPGEIMRSMWSKTDKGFIRQSSTIDCSMMLLLLPCPVSLCLFIQSIKTVLHSENTSLLQSWFMAFINSSSPLTHTSFLICHRFYSRQGSCVWSSSHLVDLISVLSWNNFLLTVHFMIYKPFQVFVCNIKPCRCERLSCVCLFKSF